MGFLETIFGKTHEEEIARNADLENWNDIVYTRKDLDMNDPVQRREYVGSCLAQMEEAARELDSLELEYYDVTSHLRDIEEIDALPEDKRQEINECAQKILDSEQQREKFSRRKSKMTEEEYERMERLQSEAKSGYK